MSRSARLIFHRVLHHRTVRRGGSFLRVDNPFSGTRKRGSLMAVAELENRRSRTCGVDLVISVLRQRAPAENGELKRALTRNPKEVLIMCPLMNSPNSFDGMAIGLKSNGVKGHQLTHKWGLSPLPRYS